MLWSSVLLLALTLGCSSKQGKSPLEPGNQSTLPQGTAAPGAALGSPVQRGDLQESALAIYTIEIAPNSMEATARLRETRSGQQNDDLYSLAIDRFLIADSFQLTEIESTASTLDVGYLITHPFPAPADPTGTPNGRTNRSDLGIAGMVVFLVDVPSATGNTYFTDRVANTSLIANADAYYSPGDLLTLTGTANTFPYRQLVDETIDGTGSRQGIDNGGDPTGNFGVDGWTRSEFGPTNDGWTGYGILHQGQASAGVLSLNKSAIGGGVHLDVAILAKYNDPRGGATSLEKRGNRLPPATADASRYAYRMPHGALDVGRLEFAGQTGSFITNTISAATLHVHVEDFDARATETSASDLSGDAAFDTVAVGESGIPTLEVCIPGVIGGPSTVNTMTLLDDDSAYGGDAAQDSGHPGDALYFSELLTNPSVSGQLGGTYTGMLRATDPETGLVVGLDADLAPLTNTPLPITYQAFSTQLTSPGNTPPTANVNLTSGNPLLSGTMPSLSIDTIADAQNDTVSVLVDWGRGGGFVIVASGLNNPYPAQNPVGTQHNNTTLTPTAINMTVRVQDAFGFTDYPVSYQLGPNRPPQVTGTPALANNSLPTPATFTMNIGTATATDPEGDAISYTITNNRNANQVSFASFPNAANTTAITNPPNVSAQFTTYANDALHPTTGGTAYPVVPAAIVLSNTAAWVYTPVSSTAGEDYPYSVVVDPEQNVWVTGSWATNAPGIDFGGGLVPALAGRPMFLLKLNGTTGAYMLHRVWTASGAASACRTMSLTSDLDGNIYVSLVWSGTLSISGLGGGAVDQVAPGTSLTGDFGILKFSPSGAFLGLVRSNDAAEHNAAKPPTSTSGASNHGVGSRGLICDRFTGALFGVVTCNPSIAQNYGGTTLPVVAGAGLLGTLVRYETGAFAPAGTGAATWARRISAGTFAQHPMTLAFDPSGNVFVGGAFRGTGHDFGAGPVDAVGASNVSDGYLVKYTPAGTYVSGSFKQFGSTDPACADLVACIVADTTGIYLSGSWGQSTVNAPFTLGAPLGNMISGGDNTGYVGMLTPAGVPVWQRSLGGLGFGGTHSANGGLHRVGNELIVHGMLSVSNLTGWGYPNTASGGSIQGVVAKYSAASGATGYWANFWAQTPFIGWRYTGGSDLMQSGDLVHECLSGSAGTWDWDPGPGTISRTTTADDIVVMRVYGSSGGFTP